MGESCNAPIFGPLLFNRVFFDYLSFNIILLINNIFSMYFIAVYILSHFVGVWAIFEIRGESGISGKFVIRIDI